MDLEITGRTALVLGGGGGLGGAIARELAAEGATVVVAGRSAGPLDTTVAEITAAGGRAHALVWDLGELDVVEARIGWIEETVGGVDILVGNTGGPPPGAVTAADASVWEMQFRSMVLSVITITNRVLPGMRERGWGRVITSTSSGVVAPIPGLGLSNALRSTLLGWSKTPAGEVAADGITANVVVPGRIATDRVAFLGRGQGRARGHDRRGGHRREPRDDPRRPLRRSTRVRPDRHFPRRGARRLHHRVGRPRRRRLRPGDLNYPTLREPR
ncbi:SDR family NAD(P)-dependent oxidoreductase [Janibacter limosus]|uniref:SDR family NAD(P)-dependent oxidoreductase n=1 Tax=Janibacter limosus TaxID=53458 RepID=A0AC61U2G6_9MICO|nr:SDR family NAD(P)-dependent oxidoreductase [Janibacter limosus]UUZ44201.1 SDR family NAD(P)-dependent oxidoreductase [Janibacter limosus]